MAFRSRLRPATRAPLPILVIAGLSASAVALMYAFTQRAAPATATPAPALAPTNPSAA